MTAKILKILASLVPRKKIEKKMILLVLSIAFGLIYLLCLPVILLSSLGSSKPDVSAIDLSQFTEQSFRASLDSEQAARIEDIKAAGLAIETEMADLGVASQTIKAQVIYVTYFEGVRNFDANAYANLFKFAPSDEILIDSINQNYGLSIDYEEYLHNYTFIMNTTINPYMFTDASTKNAADLAAWAFNAYESGWGFKSGFIGEKSDEDRIRYCDNAGLMIGYLNYDPGQKVFDEAISTLTYTEQGDLETMPDTAGIGLFDGTKHGVYIGNGEVIFSDEAVGYVTRQAVADGRWIRWCTYEGITYPQAVEGRINELNADDSSNESQAESGGDS